MRRRAFRGIGAPARVLLTGLIRVYRVTLSGWLGGQCRYYPTCSHYAEEAIQVHGAVKGTGLAVWRVLRCNPFGGGGVDRVPGGAPDDEYESIIPSARERAV
jgi:putative membrane protein insertion efficiency factor